MADSGKGVEDSPTRGFSIVDSLPSSMVTPENDENSDRTVKVASEEKKTEAADPVVQNAVSTKEAKHVEDKELDDIDIIILDDSDCGRDKEVSKDCTLIITTEDLLEASTSADDTIVVEAKQDEEKSKSPEPEPVVESPKTFTVKPKIKKDEGGYFWVSNITQQVKAADLKKFFSQIGKVLTAKILTNGRNYFGYVSMYSDEAAAKCIKQLNNAIFDGKKIVVSKIRPDTRDAKPAVNVTPKRKKIEKVEPKRAQSPEKKRATEPKPTLAEVKEKYNSAISELKKKLELAKSEADKYRQKVTEFERRHEGMRKKCESLERELKDAQYKMRNERRRLNQDREEFEKTKKLEQMRFETDRAAVNRELDEVKKLREHLKEKIDEFKAQSKKVMKRRSRSPPVVRREVRARSPPLRANPPSNSFRPDERKRKRDVSRGRTPPPPPKLGDMGKKRNDRENQGTSRSFFAQPEKRVAPPSQGYDFRHKAGYGLPPDEYRGHWPSTFTKEARRTATAAPSQTFQPEVRFSSYQFGSSTASAPSRSYYQEFGKPYGPY